MEDRQQIANETSVSGIHCDLIDSHVLSDSEEDEIREFLMLERTFEQEHAQSQVECINRMSDLLQKQHLNDKDSDDKPSTDLKSITSNGNTTKGQQKVNCERNQPQQSINCDSSDNNQKLPETSATSLQTQNNTRPEQDEQSDSEEDNHLSSSLLSDNSFWNQNGVLNATTSTCSDAGSGPVFRRNLNDVSLQNQFHSNSSSSGIVSSNHTHGQQRPLTIYLPNPDVQLDLVVHVQTLGHDLSSIGSNIELTSDQCCGYLYKQKTTSVHSWQKRFFVFDRNIKKLLYFGSECEYRKHKKANAEIRFEQIENVYVDHGRNANKSMTVKSSRPVDRLKRLQLKWRTGSAHRHVFVVKTHARDLVLSTFVPELMRIWIDVIFTGAQAYLDF